MDRGHRMAIGVLQTQMPKRLTHAKPVRFGVSWRNSGDCNPSIIVESRGECVRQKPRFSEDFPTDLVPFPDFIPDNMLFE